MKVLVISQYYVPDITAAAFRISETVEGLKKRGVKVHVITSTPHKSTFNQKDIKNELGITRIKVPFFTKQTKITYAFQYLSFCTISIFAALKIRKDFKYDIIFSSSPPITIAFPAFIIRFLTKRPLVFDIRDIWPDSAVAIDKIGTKSFLYKLFKFIEKYIYIRADKLTCVAEPMKDYINGISGRDDISVIYNGVSNEFLDNSTKDFIKKNKGEFILSYAGNIGYAQGIAYLLRAYSVFFKSANNKNIRLQIIGNGAEKEKIIQLSNELGISENIDFHNALPKIELTKILRRSDILLIPLIESDVFKLTIPSKIFDYLSFSIPIISSTEGEAEEILLRSKANIVSSLENLEALSASINKMYLNYEFYKDHANTNLKIANEYSRDKSTKEFYKIFLDLLK